MPHQDAHVRNLRRQHRLERLKLAIRTMHPETISTWATLRKLDGLQSTPEEMVQNVVDYCYANVPYYKRLLDDIGQTQKVDFASVPMLTKSRLRKNFADLIARSRTGAVLGDPHFSILRTSGSTGYPSSHIKSKSDRLVGTASLKRIFTDISAPTTGTIFDLGLHWAGQPTVQGRRFPGAFICYNFAGYSFELEELVEEHLAILHVAEPDIIFGSPSRIAALCRFAQAHGIVLRPRNVLLSYEHLVASTAEYLASQLGSALTQIYGTAETGILGWSCSSGCIHLDNRTALAEIVDEDGKAVAPGTVGQIVVTPLRIATQPLLRFDTGDRAAFLAEPCSCGNASPALKTFEGRSADWIRSPSGVHFSPFALYGLVDALGQSEYQIVQRPDGQLHLLFPDGEELTDRQLKYLDKAIERYFREKVNYSIIYGDNYVRTSNGKRNAFVQQMPIETSSVDSTGSIEELTS